MRLQSLLIVVAALGAALAVAGCKNARLDGLVPAEGVVTFNGEPVEGATVMFAPKTYGEKSASATAITGADGKFKLMTLDPGDGAYPGEYSIAVTKDRIEGLLSLDEVKRRTADPNGTRNEETPEQTVVHELPVKYGDINTSGLTFSLSQSGDKNISLALEGEVDLTPQKLNGPGGGASVRH